MSKNTKIIEKKDNYIEHLINLDITLIVPPRIAMRSNIFMNKIEQLANSIKEIGLICPICVMKYGDKYEIVAGNRRFEAVKSLGWVTIPCICIEENSEKYFQTMSAENYEREDIGIFDEVQFIQKLKYELDMNQSQIAKFINKSSSYITERLAILDYPNILLDALLNEKITFSVAREFNKITEPQVLETYLHYAIENGCTPDIARKWRKQWEISKNQPERDILQEASENYEESQQSIINTMKCAGCENMFELPELSSLYFCKSCRTHILSPS